MVLTAQCAEQFMKDWNCKSPTLSLVCDIPIKLDCPELVLLVMLDSCLNGYIDGFRAISD